MPLNRQIKLQNWGSIPYAEAWKAQEEVFRATIDRKILNRSRDLSERQLTENHLVLCEHPHVYTLGKSGSMENLLLNEQQLSEKNIEFYKINRGGDITYHGPGQIVGYPILDLDHFFTDIHLYLRLLEDTMIRTLADYGIKSGRLPGSTGVWLDPNIPEKARKICAMGIRCSRWVTMHGWALNVNTDLAYFKYIIPCGIDDKQVTSMQYELGHKLDKHEVQSKILEHFADLFEAEVSPL